MAIGKPTPTVQLDISGNLSVSNVSYLSNITEKINVASVGADLSCNLDFSKGSVFYLGTILSNNIRFNIQNIPSITDLSRSYIVTAMYKGNSVSSSNNFYGNVVSVNTGTNPANAAVFTPNFGVTPTTYSTKNALITQTMAYLYFADASYVISNVTNYSS